MVLFDNATFDKLLAEAGKQKVVTPATLSERFRVRSFGFHLTAFELIRLGIVLFSVLVLLLVVLGLFIFFKKKFSDCTSRL